MDNELVCIRDDIFPTNLNMVAADEHMGVDVERLIRIVKEGTRVPTYINSHMNNKKI